MEIHLSKTLDVYEIHVDAKIPTSFLLKYSCHFHGHDATKRTILIRKTNIRFLQDVIDRLLAYEIQEEIDRRGN